MKCNCSITLMSVCWYVQYLCKKRIIYTCLNEDWNALTGRRTYVSTDRQNHLWSEEIFCIYHGIKAHSAVYRNTFLIPRFGEKSYLFGELFSNLSRWNSNRKRGKTGKLEYREKLKRGILSTAFEFPDTLLPFCPLACCWRVLAPQNCLIFFPNVRMCRIEMLFQACG